MRPNLMSPRRTTTSGEDSILAMLEREPTRKRGAGASGARLAWYGAGAGLAIVLTGTLVWLAANNDGLRPDVQEAVLADAGKAPPPMLDTPVRQVAMAPAAAPPESQAASAAVIVDQPPPAEAVPALRLLKPAPAKAVEKPAQEKPAPAVRVPVPAPVRAAAPAAAAARPVARTVSPSRPAPATAAAPAKPKPVMVAKNAARPVPQKAGRTVNPARTSDAAVDADVALISAVIVHANGHASENSQMTELLCPNDSCKERPAKD